MAAGRCCHGHGPARPGRCGRGTTAAPAPPARSSSALTATWCAESAALRHQQSGDELRQFPWDVKRGTIGDHGSPSAEDDLVVKPLLLGLHAYFRAVRFVASLPGRPRLGGDGRDARTYFAEIASLCSSVKTRISCLAR